MALDGMLMRLLTGELLTVLKDAKVDKVYQTQKTEIILLLRTRSGSFRLLISASGNAPRLHLTTQKIENPKNPPMLCMLLRKHLTSATLVSVEQCGLDRILTLNFSAVNELGDRVRRTLAVEIMAQYSNIILLDENDIIIDSVKRVDETKSSVRQILPRLKYTLPPKRDRLDVTLVSAQEIIDRLVSCDKPVASALLGTLEGMSPVLCRELAFRAGCGELSASALPERALEKLKFELEALKATLETRSIAPTSVADESGRLIDFSFIPITQYGQKAVYRSYDSLSELLEAFYYERERLTRTRAKADDLFKTVNTLIERSAKKLSNRMAELEACRDKEEKRKFAELISANLYRLEKGQKAYELDDYYTGERLVIPVRPELTPVENAQRYYKEYKKLKTAEELLGELTEQSEQETEYLKTVLDALQRCETESEIAQIRAELAQQGFIKAQPQSKLKQQKALPPLEFTSPSGFKVLVGRNNVQNDKLSLKTAAKTDMWFHIQKAPGSHVVLLLGGGAALPQDMEFAAKTAAFYSSGRQAGAVEVDYTQAGNLKKPVGAKPGYVIYHVYNSMLVPPEKPDGESEA